MKQKISRRSACASIGRLSVLAPFLPLLESCSGGTEREKNTGVVQSIERKKYNLVVLAIDTLRADHLGCYGYPRDTSPNIDRFAKKCFRFDNAFSPSGWTVPSFASLFTGQYPMTHGMMRGDELYPDDMMMIQDVLENSEDYASVYFVAKSYLKSMGRRGLAHQFDKWQYWERYDLKHYEAVLEFIEENKTQPFYLFFHTFDVHGPYLPPSPFHRKFVFDEFFGEEVVEVPVQEKDFMDSQIILPERGVAPGFLEAMKSNDARYIISQYDGTIAYTDAMVGKVLDSLENNGLLDRTIVLIMSDHGESMAEHDLFFAHTSYYEQVNRIPFLMYVPNTNPRTIPGQIQLEDVFPTICDLFGLSIPPSVEGVSFLPLLTGERESVRDYTYSLGVHYGTIRGDFKDSCWKLVLPGGTDKKGRQLSEPFLFNLTDDPEEMKNFYGTGLEVEDFLKAKYREWRSRPVGESKSGDYEKADFDEEALEALRNFGYL